MAAKKKLSEVIDALNTVLEALDSLEQGDQAWVLQTAASRVGVTGVTAKSSQRGAGNSPQEDADELSRQTPRQFMRSKSPKNDVQRVACLAFYLTHARDQPHFQARDLSALNTEAAGHSMNMPRAANNATRQNKYLAPAGSGNKQLTALGEDVVNALPNQEAVKAAEQQSRPRRKKASRKKKKKKKKGKASTK